LLYKRSFGCVNEKSENEPALTNTDNEQVSLQKLRVLFISSGEGACPWGSFPGSVRKGGAGEENFLYQASRIWNPPLRFARAPPRSSRPFAMAMGNYRQSGK
jgi:hypothetical protein